jgi:hypothetical protein
MNLQAQAFYWNTWSLKREAVRFYATPVLTFGSAWRYVPEYLDLNKFLFAKMWAEVNAQDGAG